MIKFELFDTENSYQCHFASLGTFVVSIAHYMRAYFNFMALVNGRDFQLPGDAGYLNCILLQETAYADTMLYAKIGCMERETFTSTKLALHVYTDAQCSVPYEDGETSRRHAAKGYTINGYTFGTRVSFQPPFYSCETCAPEEISDTFNKKSGTWYDDDYISSYGTKQKNNEEEDGDEDAADDYYQDDYTDDAYLAANDDINNDDGAYGGDDYYAGDDGRRNLVVAAPGQLEVRHDAYLDLRLVVFYSYLYSQQYSFFIFRPTSRNSGKKSRVNVSSTTKTMMPVTGICASACTSTVFGATRTAAHWIRSAEMDGQVPMSSCCPLCARS
jgi:hypothetical protein